MKVLGVSGSPRMETTAKLVQEVLNHTGAETEFISLKGKDIRPCIACLGCIEDNVCAQDDDLKKLRDKIVEADAYVIGAANYFSHVNGLAHCFLERWYQFRHRQGQEVAGKLAVAVGVGGGESKSTADAIETFMSYNLIDTVAKVTAQGAASCFTCGYGEVCQVGAIYMFFGPGTKITEDIIPRLEKQPAVIEAAQQAGKLLGERLLKGNDREKTVEKVAAAIGLKFKEAT